MMKTNYFIFLFMIVSLLACGCIIKDNNNQTIYQSKWQFPDVIAFLREYPNASATETEFDRFSTALKIDEWRNYCPNMVISEYKLLNFSLPPASLSVWIDNNTNDMICAVRTRDNVYAHETSQPKNENTGEISPATTSTSTNTEDVAEYYATTSTDISCYDTDSYQNVEINYSLGEKGVCSDYLGSHEDACIDGKNLKEFYCGENNLGKIMCLYKLYKCTGYGYSICVDGACISNTNTAITSSATTTSPKTSTTIITNSVSIYGIGNYGEIYFMGKSYLFEIKGYNTDERTIYLYLNGQLTHPYGWREGYNYSVGDVIFQVNEVNISGRGTPSENAGTRLIAYQSLSPGTTTSTTTSSTTTSSITTSTSTTTTTTQNMSCESFCRNNYGSKYISSYCGYFSPDVQYTPPSPCDGNDFVGYSMTSDNIYCQGYSQYYKCVCKHLKEQCNYGCDSTGCKSPPKITTTNTTTTSTTVPLPSCESKCSSYYGTYHISGICQDAAPSPSKGCLWYSSSETYRYDTMSGSSCPSTCWCKHKSTCSGKLICQDGDCLLPSTTTSTTITPTNQFDFVVIFMRSMTTCIVGDSRDYYFSGNVLMINDSYLYNDAIVVKPSDSRCTNGIILHTELSDNDVEIIKQNINVAVRKIREYSSDKIILNPRYYDYSGEVEMSAWGKALVVFSHRVPASAIDFARGADATYLFFNDKGSSGYNDIFIPYAGFANGLDYGIAGGGYSSSSMSVMRISMLSASNVIIHEFLHQLDYALEYTSRIYDIYSINRLTCSQAKSFCGNADPDTYKWFPSTDWLGCDPDYPACTCQVGEAPDEYYAANCPSDHNICLDDFYKHMLQKHIRPGTNIILSHCKDGVNDYGETGVDSGGRCN